jgi:protein-tyrosine phosphatase
MAAINLKRPTIKEINMDNTPFGVQLEIYQFEEVTENSSRLTMHVVYESVAQRDQVLKMPFAQGINMAHNRLQEIVSKLSDQLTHQ